MNYDNKKIIVSVSGGKDSTAMCLNLLEQGYTKDDFTCVFMNTGWEHERTYEYLDQLEKTIGKIIRLKQHIDYPEEYKEHVEYFEQKLGYESPFIRGIFKMRIFPSSRVKWCTKYIKIDPIKEYFDSLDCDYVNLVGIRKEESLRRANMTEWEYNNFFDCWTHRPLIDWTEKQVIDIHRRFNLQPNFLYLNGSSRVGCYPCINSRKAEIKSLTPERIDLIKELEEVITNIRAQRTGTRKPITFFNRSGISMSIEEAHQWSKTTRGGKQFELFSTEEPTCVKWGMCEFKGEENE